MTSRKTSTTLTQLSRSPHSGRPHKRPRQLIPCPPPQVSSPKGLGCLESALHAGNVAQERLRNLEANTRLQPQDDIMELDWDEVFVEDLIGVGGFASVCLVSCPKLRRKHQGKGMANPMDESESLLSIDPSWFSELSVEESDDWSNMYALKNLSNRTMSRAQRFATGAADLLSEAFLLMRLSHPHIIQMFGKTSGSVQDAFTKKGGYFIVLEALETTLSDKLQIWRRCPVSSVDEFFQRSRTKNVPLVEERLDIVIDVAKGMEYLHSANVIFRDLKPENIGFDRNGTVKLFDFGLSREVYVDRLPGIAGSARYLAPETILGKFTCKASDVYAFAILTWEVISLRMPYRSFQEVSALQKAVAIEGHRPDASKVSHPVKTLIETCWQSNPKSRPPFPIVLNALYAMKTPIANTTKMERKLCTISRKQVQTGLGITSPEFLPLQEHA